MIVDDHPERRVEVSCTYCACQVPLDEAVVPEALPYVVYFCGLDCYDRWRIRAERLVGGSTD